VDILGMLPLLDGWSYLRVNGSQSLPAGETVTLYESDGDEQSWLIGAVFHSDVADAGLVLNLYTPGGQTLTYDLNPAKLYANGFTQPNRVEPYVAVYDDTANSYGAIFQPSTVLPLVGQLAVSLIGGSSDATVAYDAQLVRIGDPSAFTESLQAVLGIASLDQLLQLISKYTYATAKEVAPPTPQQLPSPVPQAGTYSGFEP